MGNHYDPRDEDKDDCTLSDLGERIKINIAKTDAYEIGDAFYKIKRNLLHVESDVIGGKSIDILRTIVQLLRDMEKA